MRPHSLLLPLLLLPLAVAPPSARAAESYDGCAYVITSLPALLTTQGVWCLTADVSTALASGDAITIAANNVTLDCNGFKIGGLAAGPGTTAMGVAANGRLNVTIRGCTIRGFVRGMNLVDVDGALVEDNVLDGNLGTGIWLRGEGGMVRGNRVVDTGRTPNLATATGIAVEGANDVVDNTVSGVLQSYANGIHVTSGSGASIVGNRVRGLSGNNGAAGIILYGSRGAFARDNHVSGPGTTGISCANGQALAIRNAASGFTTGIGAGCLLSGNLVQAPE